jgi:hypothetical protein
MTWSYLGKPKYYTKAVGTKTKLGTLQNTNSICKFQLDFCNTSNKLCGKEIRIVISFIIAPTEKT